MKDFFLVIPREQSDRGNLPGSLKIARPLRYARPIKLHRCERAKHFGQATRIARNDKGHGFTLAELLVVMAITAIIGTILVVIFTNTLRGSNKSQILSVIKQNGQAVLENLDKTIRSADDAVCSASFFPGRTLVISQDGVYTRYRIVFRDDVVGTAPSSCIGSEKNGCIIQDNPVKQQDPDTDKLETDSAFVLRACNSNDPMSSAQVLTDTNLQTGVWVKSGSFNVSRSAGHKATVTVNFTLKPGAGAPSVVAGQIDDVAFQTTIGLR